VELNGELFIRDRNQWAELPKLYFALEHIKPKKMSRWAVHEPKLQNPLKLNQWNSVTYSFIIDVRKYSAADQKYELTYYLLNQKIRKVKLRKSRVETLVWK
jgi:hypothetical protein